MTQDICTCTPCPTCKGSRTEWIFMGKNYGQNHPMDDMAELEPCEDCGGEGIDEMCDRCRDLMEKEEIGD